VLVFWGPFQLWGERAKGSVERREKEAVSVDDGTRMESLAVGRGS